MFPALLVAAMLIRPSRAGWFEAPARWLPPHEVSADALVALVHDAQVVALADATHGTHEFFAAKQELVPKFAADGVRTIAYEAPYAEWERGNYDVADYYFWHYEETLALIAWARAQNPPLRVIGIDCTHPIEAIDLLVERVRSIDASLAPDIENRYRCLTDYRDRTLSYSTLSPVDRELCRTSVWSVRPLLHDEELAHNARVIEQGEESFYTGLRNRDEAMGENLVWAAQHYGRIVVLGHNEHFGRTPYSLFGGQAVASAGMSVMQNVPYFAMGSVVLQGSFLTYDVGGYVDRTLPKPSADDIALALHEGGTSFYLPIRGVLPAWLTLPHHVRIAGSAGPVLNLTEDVAKKFDALYYVENSTPATLR